jgi:hypothetical protein
MARSSATRLYRASIVKKERFFDLTEAIFGQREILSTETTESTEFVAVFHAMSETRVNTIGITGLALFFIRTPNRATWTQIIIHLPAERITSLFPCTSFQL